MFKKLTSIVLAGVMALSVMASVTAADINQSGGSADSKVMLDIGSRDLKVTVPSVLPIWVDSDNNVTVATNAKIQNRSDGPVDVTNVSVEADNNWSLVNFNTDFSKVPVDTKQYGMTMYNNDVVNGVPVSAFDTIDGGSELAVVYDGNVAIQSSDIDKLDIGHVVFTVGWSKTKTDIAPTGRNALPMVKSLRTMNRSKLFKAHNLVLNGSIDMSYVINPAAVGINPDDVESLSLSLTCDKYSDVTSDFIRNGDYFIVTTSIVPIAYMSHNVHAVATINGIEQSETDDYSVQEYAETVLADPAQYVASDKIDEIVDLMKEMLNYGIKAGNVFKSQMLSEPNYHEIDNYTMDDVSVDMIDAAISAQNDGRAATDMSTVHPESKANFYTPSVLFLSKSTLRMIFSISGGSTHVSEWDGSQQNHFYWVDRSDIAAQDIDVLQEFTVNNTTFYYSLLDYAKAVLVSSTTSEDAKLLVRAMYLYNQAANAYFD